MSLVFLLKLFFAGLGCATSLIRSLHNRGNIRRRNADVVQSARVERRQLAVERVAFTPHSKPLPQRANTLSAMTLWQHARLLQYPRTEHENYATPCEQYRFKQYCFAALQLLPALNCAGRKCGHLYREHKQ
jgi:hypothetical protein